MIRSNQLDSQTTSRHWKSLYRAAIFERNKIAILERILEAERAVLARGQELLHGGGSREERNALDNALLALRAYRSAVQRTEAA
jgi:hypothetical protein